ncbi:Oxygen-dependent coproporphyrinogen-III oxidase [Colletotrichum gloeosporioides]|uniref:coproporphyrinogen oxidase n=1 Tax=Colletotrichum gloeosporioides TaxID=474922 RepID=A0A8H4CI05_COLGL|nr:Oxygen-dependent coproporphyrinogen-III oxidase [Colletotrichum gloeosporioides]KAF3804308.1 Oxygen-dependent coproporphyrinogen-III oxidase [Colletotrichum gloeosporioides]
MAHENSDAYPMRLRMEAFIRRKQTEIISALEALDGATFRTDEWERPNGGGGGRTCVLQDGHVLEKAGVNISIVHGKLNRSAVEEMRQNHKNIATDADELDFYALGLSMVVHPKNPMAPTVHMNGRYFETVRDGSVQTSWFGGGSDLTPSYLFEEDAKHFHATLKSACDEHDVGYYPKFKKWCDEYFNIKHRGERRGVGGIFFDDLDENFGNLEQIFAFVQATMNALVPAYIPIVEKRKALPFNDHEKEWQQIRRGRYVEFNLVHDRGTAFGLNVPGSRIESILISLPVTAQWHYMYEEPEPDSREGKLLEVLRSPREWV